MDSSEQDEQQRMALVEFLEKGDWEGGNFEVIINWPDMVPTELQAIADQIRRWNSKFETRLTQLCEKAGIAW